LKFLFAQSCVVKGYKEVCFFIFWNGVFSISYPHTYFLAEHAMINHGCSVKKKKTLKGCRYRGDSTVRLAWAPARAAHPIILFIF
jgi:hypothetical protein